MTVDVEFHDARHSAAHYELTHLTSQRNIPDQFFLETGHVLTS
jgi:hypothetical protein